MRLSVFRLNRTVSRVFPFLALAAALIFVGCSDEDGGSSDTGPVPDTATDTSSDAADGGEPLDIPGLSAPVTARFDEWGVLHLECETFEDCVAAQGYFHADKRFFEMDLIRRQTRGRLSTMIGLNLGFEMDRRFRQLMSTRDGEPLPEAYIAELNEPTRSMLEAYRSGVNAWLEDMRNGEHGATLTEEYESPLISDDIPDWELEDSIALYLQLAFQLSLDSRSDIFRGEMVDDLGAEVARDFFTVKPGPVSNIMEVREATSLGSGDEGDLEAIRRIQRRLEPASRALTDARQTLESTSSLLFGPHSPRDGSNNWVVSDDQTQNGDALLANDPHLSLNNPAIWYYTEMRVTGAEEGIHVAGASIPATPGVIVGHNENVAWGVTTARLDLADAYVETLTDDGSAVMRDGQRVSLIEKTITLQGQGDNTREVAMEWVPEHGPLISKDESNNRGVSVKWVAQNAGPDFNFLLPMLRSSSVEEAVDALDPLQTISQSWVFADTSGSIAWKPEGVIPDRTEWNSPSSPNWLPLDGDGSNEWNGRIPEDRHPKIVDPPRGYIATANNDFDGSYTDGDPTNDGHPVWQSPPAPGNRHTRISQLLEDGAGSHSVETMEDIQSDTFSIQGETLTPHILDAAASASSLSDGASEVVAALENWNFECPTGLDGTDPEEAGPAGDESIRTEAIGCSAFHVTMPFLTEGVFGDELEPSDFDATEQWARLQVALWYVFEAPSELARGTDYFDDVTTEEERETESEIVAAALDEAAGRLGELFDSSDRNEWLWGRIHTVSIRSLFASAGFDQWNEGPWANDGGLSTVDVANPTGETFSHTRGPSLRLIAELGSDGVEAQFQLPGGQDHHRDADTYISLVDEWLRNESRPLHFEPTEVREAAVETLVLEPTN